MSRLQSLKLIFATVLIKIFVQRGVNIAARANKLAAASANEAAPLAMMINTLCDKNGRW